MIIYTVFNRPQRVRFAVWIWIPNRGELFLQKKETLHGTSANKLNSCKDLGMFRACGARNHFSARIQCSAGM